MLTAWISVNYYLQPFYWKLACCIFLVKMHMRLNLLKTLIFLLLCSSEKVKVLNSN